MSLSVIMYLNSSLTVNNFEVDAITGCLFLFTYQTESIQNAFLNSMQLQKKQTIEGISMFVAVVVLIQLRDWFHFGG